METLFGWKNGNGQKEEAVVTIPFHIILEDNSHKAKVVIPESFRDRRVRKFYIDYAVLVPEYFSRQAVVYDMDPTDLADVEYPIQVEFEWAQGVTKRQVGQPWSMPTGSATRPAKMDEILKSINVYMDRNKPVGCKYPLVFFDWVHIDWKESGMELNEFHVEVASLYYQEDYSPETHGNYLPASLKDFPFYSLNHQRFPTLPSEDIEDTVRIRMHIMPFSSVAMSNTSLMEQMGFDKARQIGSLRTHYNQFRYFATSEPKMMQAIGAPSMTVIEKNPIKVYMHLDRDSDVSRMGTVKTSRSREVKPSQLVADINDAISALGASMNLEASVAYVQRQIKAVNGGGNVKITLLVDKRLSQKMGYKGVERITSSTVADTFPGELAITEATKKAQTLVMDTLNVFVKLENSQASYTTSGFNEQVLAVLLPKADGFMETRKTSFRSPMEVTYFNSECDIGLYRFNEKGDIMPLSWKVRSYLVGLLVGV